MRFAAILAGFLISASPAHGESFDSIAAIVNNEAITCSDIDRDIKNTYLQFKQSGQEGQLPPASQLQERVLDGRITRILQLQEARKLELGVSDEELADAIANVEAQNRLLPGQLEEVLVRQGMDVDEYKTNMREQLLVSKLINMDVRSKLSISNEAMKEFYRKHIANPQPRREVQLAQIFLELPGEPTPEQLAEVRSLAIEIHRQLQEGKNFAQMAVLHSDSPDRQGGGLMGWFAEGAISQRFAAAVELPVGGISMPIRSPSGFHIFKAVEERWQEQQPAGESRDEVHARHILLQIPSSSDEATRAKIMHRAQSIASEMQDASDEEFAARAKEVSQGPSASNGGDLGWFSKGMMVPVFEQAVEKLAVGQTSDVVESAFGLHIIRVVAKRHIDPNSFEAHREAIQQTLTNVEMQEQLPRYISSLKAQASIEIRGCQDTAGAN